jgi:hypothetical protein
MTIQLNPPPLQVPGDLNQNKAQQNFWNTLLNTIYQLWNAVYGIRTQVTAQTTDNTVTAIIRVPVREGTTVMIDCKIVARRTGGSSGSDGDSAFYNLTGAYKNVGGTLTGIGTPVLQGGEDQSGWNVGFSNSGTEATVTVLGANNNEITWEGTISTYTVGA